MVAIDTVLVKLTSRCNLDCDYCYVYNMGDDTWRRQPKLMSIDTIKVLGRGLRDVVERQQRPLSIVFHGGEPLLMGATRFEQVCSILRSYIGPENGLHVQTNGLLLTNSLIDLLAHFDVGISISLDGPPEIHNRHRRDRRGRNTHSGVLAAIKRLVEHPAGARLFSGLLAVVDLTSDPAAVYADLKSTGTPSVDFLYRDGNHDKLPVGKASLDSSEYGDWMVRLLDVYLADQMPIRVRVLDDMLRLLLGGRAVKEGVGDADFGILVVDTDGTITKNDTLKSASGADRFVGDWSVDTLEDLIGSTEFHAYRLAQRPSAPQCLNCPDFAVCGGGMPTHRWSGVNGLSNPSVFCADQKRLIDHMRSQLKLQAVE